MGKVQLLADYFHINKSDLIEEQNALSPEIPDTLNDETIKIALEISENPDLKLLFEMSLKMTPEQLKAQVEFIKKMQESE